ncbi:Asm4p [Saccharomyces cerevisiae x Saccharomyces kudriavzevii VIN7]|uniref:Asm4p n=1 Tax=Saccharomyces cerevisiae x Saccharomyces kudriavzevii (strain VIN7) TaxID=1095631 RepID=H0GSD1_SACCK|nr:Asm4p [Saccharomyces cerevisiae x Saccharomyces kudriavzevii VIN7]
MFGAHSGNNTNVFSNPTSQPAQTTPMFQQQPQPQQPTQQQQQRTQLNASYGSGPSQFGTSFSDNVNANNNSSNISSNSVYNNNNNNNNNNSTNQRNQGNNPSWVNNPKKRSTPHTVIRRKTTKQNSSSDISQNDDSSSINISMRSFSKQNQDTRQNERNKSAANNDLNSLLSNFNDAPPTVTLQDWQREDEFGSIPSLTTQFVTNKYAAKKLNSSAYDSKNTPNVFDKDSYVRIANIEKNHSNNDENTADTNSGNAHGTSSKSSNLSAVIVFGYPESIANEVIKHFSLFGHIMEDFQVLRLGRGISPSSFKLFHNDDTSSDHSDSTVNKTITIKGRDNESISKKYAIFTGESWVKLTYNSPSSALRALQENGTIFHGALIGCIPYSKNAVEQLAGCKVDNIDDIGEFNISMYQYSSTSSSSNTPSPPNVSLTNDTFLNKDSNASAISVGNATNLLGPKLVNPQSKRLDVKDGKSLFIQNANANSNIPTLLQSLESKMRQQEARYRNNESAGFIHKLNNWLFGWNDL